MKRIFAFTMLAVSVIAEILFMETMRMQSENEKIRHGTFAMRISAEVAV